jgi:hypothetical protein
MNYRKALGREIALLGRVTRKRGAWLVPSRNRAGLKYHVKLDGEKSTCTCPDFVTNNKLCKHIYAVIFHTEYPKTVFVDAQPLTPVKKKKKTYKQNWRAYNESQTREKEFFLRLLKGLCETIPHESQKRVGATFNSNSRRRLCGHFQGVPWDLGASIHDGPSRGPYFGIHLVCATLQQRY